MDIKLEYVNCNFCGRDAAVRLLSKLGLVDLEKDFVPVSFASKLGYSFIFKSIATAAGRKRLPFAVKL